MSTCAGDLIKPPRLSAGATVAVLSPSWGGPAHYPHTLESGLRTLHALGLRTREYPSTRSPNASVDARVRDLHAAFADPAIGAIWASIGGEDSLRLLPRLDAGLVGAHPKIVVGYSDTCTLLAYLRSLGHVAFHGPAVMAGLAQAAAYPAEFLDHLRRILFAAAADLTYPEFRVAAERYADWSDPANADRVDDLLPNEGARIVQPGATVRGRLWGGCVEVLEMLKGTPWWPGPERWAGAVVMMEGSEEAPPPALYRRTLRSWAAAGCLSEVAALLIGRPKGYTPVQVLELDSVVRTFVAEELERPELPVMSNCAFGHTDPQWLLPLGCEVEVDTRLRRVRLLERAVA